MYKKNLHKQITFSDFNQPTGLSMNPENRWVKKAAIIPWDIIEEKYAKLFKGYNGNVALPCRMALGSLLIQIEYAYSDEEIVAQIQENPYLQYFVGLPGYQDKRPFDPSTMVYFRKRFSKEILSEINDLIISQSKESDDDPPSGNSGDGKAENTQHSEDPDENEGTLILDATCAPSQIKYPQDTHLLNECRQKLERIIDELCEANNLPKPRTYRKVAYKDYLNIAKSKKKTAKKIRKAIGKQLSYIRRDFGYIKNLMEQNIALSSRQEALMCILQKLYEQQKYMYENKVHSVKDRIVSISQPYIRPIVRGKAKAPVEFGAKLDISIVSGFARIEKVSFDAYNESECLKDAVERYFTRFGHYPKRVLADKIYRNRENLSYCKSNEISLSGPALGRPRKDAVINRKKEYQDNCDRVEVERAYSLAKRKFGLGLIRTKLEDTTLNTIALSILAMNLSKVLFTQILEFILKAMNFKFNVILFADSDY